MSTGKPRRIQAPGSRLDSPADNIARPCSRTPCPSLQLCCPDTQRTTCVKGRVALANLQAAWSNNNYQAGIFMEVRMPKNAGRARPDTAADSLRNPPLHSAAPSHRQQASRLLARGQSPGYQDICWLQGRLQSRAARAAGGGGACAATPGHVQQLARQTSCRNARAARSALQQCSPGREQAGARAPSAGSGRRRALGAALLAGRPDLWQQQAGGHARAERRRDHAQAQLGADREARDLPRARAAHRTAASPRSARVARPGSREAGWQARAHAALRSAAHYTTLQRSSALRWRRGFVHAQEPVKLVPVSAARQAWCRAASRAPR